MLAGNTGARLVGWFFLGITIVVVAAIVPFMILSWCIGRSKCYALIIKFDLKRMVNLIAYALNRIIVGVTRKQKL